MGSAMVPYERAMVVLTYRFSVVTIYYDISNRSAAICHRVSPTLKSTLTWAAVHFGAKFA